MSKHIAGETTEEEKEELELVFRADPGLRNTLQFIMTLQQAPPQGLSAEEEQDLLEKGLRRFATSGENRYRTRSDFPGLRKTPKPGDYAVGAKESLDSAISLASQVNASNAYSQQQVNNAVNNLLKATQQFSTQLLQEVSVANLVAFWKFNGNAIDSSGNGHNGALVTGWTGNSAATAVDGGTLPQLVADRFGRPGMAYDFNNGATVEVPYSTSLNPQNFTISLWLKRHTTNSNNYMFSLDRWNGFKFQLQGSNFPFLTVNTTTGDHDQDDNPGVINSPDVWTHVAVSYTDGTMKFYIQGVLVKTATVTGVPLTLKTPREPGHRQRTAERRLQPDKFQRPELFLWRGFFHRITR